MGVLRLFPDPRLRLAVDTLSPLNIRVVLIEASKVLLTIFSLLFAAQRAHILTAALDYGLLLNVEVLLVPRFVLSGLC